MRIISDFYIKDLKEYERQNKVSVLDMFKDISLFNLAELVRLGNNGITFEEACDLIDDYLTEESLDELYEEIRRSLFGDQTSKESPDSNTKDLSKFKNITEFYSDLLGDLRTYGDLSWSESWGMSVSDVILEFSILSKRLKDKKQEKINDDYMLSVLISQAVWGKLPKEPPKIGDSDINEYPDLDDDAVKNMGALMKLQAFQNNKNGG